MATLAAAASSIVLRIKSRLNWPVHILYLLIAMLIPDVKQHETFGSFRMPIRKVMGTGAVPARVGRHFLQQHSFSSILSIN